MCVCVFISICVSMTTPSWPLLTGPKNPHPLSPQAQGSGGSSSAALFYPLKSVVARIPGWGWCPFDNLEHRVREHPYWERFLECIYFHYSQN